jgi:hypothetical protein
VQIPLIAEILLRGLPGRFSGQGFNFPVVKLQAQALTLRPDQFTIRERRSLPHQVVDVKNLQTKTHPGHQFVEGVKHTHGVRST